MRKPEKYDGKVDYYLYRVQFLHYANGLAWDAGTKGRSLAQVLSGDALQVLKYLPEDQLADFATLDAALKRRFGHTMNVREEKARLRTLKRSHGQTLRAFSTQVEDTIRGAFPGWAEQQLQAEMAEVFIANLNNETLSMILTQERFTTLSAALKAAERTAPPASSRSGPGAGLGEVSSGAEQGR